MSEGRFVTFTRRMNVPAAEVFRAFTHATLLRDWLTDFTSTQPRLGGHIFLQWRSGESVVGAYTRFEPPSDLSFSWNASFEPGPCQVEVKLHAEGQHTRLTLTQGPIGQGPEWKEASKALQTHWPEFLENLQSVLETGQDLRAVRRPRLGIDIDDFNADIATRLGIPVSQGVRLSGTAENSGARAAGLQKDDVLVSFNGVELVSYSSFDTALSGLKAGDRAEVIFYRALEKISVPLELSSFPAAEYPVAAEDLAVKVREMSAGVNAALSRQLEGLSEGQAARRPSENEWSVNELIAHFILMERDYQSWVADMLNDTPVRDYLEMRPNVSARIRACVQRFSGLAVLRQELELAQEETAALIAAFPADFVANRKHLYRRAAQWILGVVPSHYFDEHAAQFQAAVDAAR